MLTNANYLVNNVPFSSYYLLKFLLNVIKQFNNTFIDHMPWQ